MLNNFFLDQLIFSVILFIKISQWILLTHNAVLIRLFSFVTQSVHYIIIGNKNKILIIIFVTMEYHGNMKGIITCNIQYQ